MNRTFIMALIVPRTILRIFEVGLGIEKPTFLTRIVLLGWCTAWWNYAHQCHKYSQNVQGLHFKMNCYTLTFPVELITSLVLPCYHALAALAAEAEKLDDDLIWTFSCSKHTFCFCWKNCPKLRLKTHYFQKSDDFFMKEPKQPFSQLLIVDKMTTLFWLVKLPDSCQIWVTKWSDWSIKTAHEFDRRP